MCVNQVLGPDNGFAVVLAAERPEADKMAIFT
jgi:hypothetical protein